MQSRLEKLAATPQRVLLLFGLVLLLAGNWILPLTDRDEPRFAEASREMIQRGDYIVPWFNGDWRFDKPVLIYWCQIASYRLFGDNAFAARLPSALFTTATALLLARWGRNRMNPKAGFIAGAMFLAGLHVAVLGRAATADMAMVFFFTCAVWSGWELTRPDQPQRARWWWFFYLSLALGFLAKGPVAWLPLGGLFLGRFLRKDAFRLPLIQTVTGLLLTLFLVALWGIPAQLKTGGEFFKVGIGQHVVSRSFGVMEGHGARGVLGWIASMPLYFLTFFASFFPWSTRVPSALRRWWPERSRDNLGWYLLMQAMLVFVVFSFVKTKLPHYTMPAFPCIALWLARQLWAADEPFAWFQKRFVAMVGVVLVLTLVAFPIARNFLLTENVWRAVEHQVRPETRVMLVGYTEASLVWELRSVSTNKVSFGDPIQARNFLTNTPPLIVVLPTRDALNLGLTNNVLAQVRGVGTAKLKVPNLTVLAR
jgi:4-amino-4-deoxy-L-arabinose transferase-like glycosyltransferase